MSQYSHAYDRCQAFIDSNFVESGEEIERSPITLTISRQVFSRSHAIAERLIELLQADEELGTSYWALFDRDLVHKMLGDHDLPQRLAKYIPEDKDHSLTSTINEILGVHPSLWELFHYTCDTIQKLAKVGNVILIGRGAHIVTRGIPHVFHVRIVSPFDLRVERAAEMLDLSVMDAAKQVSQDDHARGAYVRSHFDEPIEDPYAYDMILNTANVDEQTAANILFKAMTSR